MFQLLFAPQWQHVSFMLLSSCYVFHDVPQVEDLLLVSTNTNTTTILVVVAVLIVLLIVYLYYYYYYDDYYYYYNDLIRCFCTMASLMTFRTSSFQLFLSFRFLTLGHKTLEGQKKIIIIHRVWKKRPVAFSTISLAFLVDIHSFCINGKRNEYSMTTVIYLLAQWRHNCDTSHVTTV